MNKTDRKILATAVLLLMMTLYLLYDDRLILPSDDSKDLVTIGKISQADKDVRRKVTKKFVWRSASTTDQIHVGDSLFTGPHSSAQVELSDGRILTLQENSLIVFNSNGGELNLDLRFGRLEGKIEGCVKVQIKGEEKEICGDGKNVEVDSSEGVVKTEKTLPKEIIAWSHKPPAAFYHNKNTTPLIASWKVDKKFARYRFQFSRQSDFKKIAFEEKLQVMEINTKAYPANGEYYVRVLADNLKGEPVALSKPEKIQIHEAPIPVIESPVSKTRLLVKTNVDGDLLQDNRAVIRWRYPLKDSRFELELAQDEKFTKIVSTHKEISTQTVTTEKLMTGEYYVRVRDSVVTNQVHRPWSQPVSFRIEILPAPKLPVPKILTQKVDYLAPSTEDLVVKWEPVPDAQKYQLEISKDPEFKEIQQLTTEDSQAVIPNLTPGKSYFRVKALTAKGTQSEVSTAGSMQVRLKRPVLNPAESPVVQGKTPEDPGDPQNIKVSWTDLKLADSYTVEVAEDPEFKKKTEYQSKAPESEIVLPKPGDYYWRVKAVSKEGKALTRDSEPGQIKYTLKVPLATPEPMEPFDQMTMFFQKNNSPYIWFEWKSVRQADTYHLEIATDPDFNQKILTVSTKSRRHLVKDKLPEAPLYWRVMAQGDNNRVSFWSPTRKMTIFSGRAPAGRGPSGKRR